LQELIEANSADVEEMERKNAKEKAKMEDEKAKREPVNTEKMRNYFSDKKSKTEGDYDCSFWITGMKTYVGVIFILTIICGIISGGTVAYIVGTIPDSGGVAFLMGLALFIASVIVAFLTVAMTMIFLNMAQDVSEIKQMLRKK